MIYRYYAGRGGWRFVVLFHDGRKHMRLFDSSTFEIYKIDKTKIRPRLGPYTDIRPKTLANRIKKRRRMFTRCAVGFPKKTVEKVITALTI